MTFGSLNHDAMVSERNVSAPQGAAEVTFPRPFGKLVALSIFVHGTSKWKIARQNETGFYLLFTGPDGRMVPETFDYCATGEGLPLPTLEFDGKTMDDCRRRFSDTPLPANAFRGAPAAA